MSKALRLSEKWFRRGLWLVALAFAGFLIGLGGTVVENLPRVEQTYTTENFIDAAAAKAARAALANAQAAQEEASQKLEQLELQRQAAHSDVQSARETFTNWLATRRATERAEQDPELLARTRKLDELRAAERRAQARVQEQQQVQLDARQAEQRTRQALQALEDAAREQLEVAWRQQELRVFLYRLALTLPLLVVAGWLLARKRGSIYWPFVWGFVFFAGFAFFVELVPYLPSYGGFVRYVVGIIVTVLIGRQAIVALQRYLERQRQAEQLPDSQRREELPYDLALARLAKSVCPGCERAVDLKDPANDFCPHCGIGLHDHCGHCRARKSAFSKFCHACGTPAAALAQAAPSEG
ncbi:zinc ribbon domain-containing protein [Aquabacterium sp. A7-Y]|uniref:zinc ribbon domain-containing protein n=1 Tax=Aquabacterium sp. A7-Y TaxID=1349605 RepID=UPI00223E39C0|nr:zinc ribbon domain-containing protein [Aquabacterium sp. A7-Y]MCW7541556.1 zinc ribbon domain-containing protein [Aquabacterium sp. A7-Y]